MIVEREEPHRVALDVFEGPLDLLLYLIRRDELDIYDIPIESITRHYLQHLEQMRFLDLDLAGDFLVMASTLMMIKSRMLLPVEAAAATTDDEEEMMDPRWDLVRQLVEYKKFKDVAAHLLTRESSQADAFSLRSAGVVIPDLRDEGQGWALGDVGLFDLLAAFESVLRRAPSELLGHLEPIQWRMADCMETILRRTQRGERISFLRLFEDGAPRGKIIATFLALLELLRQRRIAATQDCEFGEIMVEPVFSSPTVLAETASGVLAEGSVS